MDYKDRIILGNKEINTVKNLDGTEKNMIKETTSVFEKNIVNDYYLVSEHTEYIK